MTKPDAVKAFKKLNEKLDVYALSMEDDPWNKRKWEVTVGYYIDKTECEDITFTTYSQVTRFLEGK